MGMRGSTWSSDFMTGAGAPEVRGALSKRDAVDEERQPKTRTASVKRK